MPIQYIFIPLNLIIFSNGITPTSIIFPGFQVYFQDLSLFLHRSYIKIKMIQAAAVFPKVIVLIAIIGMVDSLTATPVLGDTNKYVNAGTYTFNMAAYYNTTTTVLNPYTYAAIFPTSYPDTTYHVGLSIQQMQYFIANKIINYTCWVDVKSPGGVTILLYTNTANKIQKLVIYLLTISPGFLNNYFSLYWLPIYSSLSNGQIYSTVLSSSSPYNLNGGVYIWSTILGVDAKTNDTTNQIGLQISVSLKSSTSVNIAITAMTSKPFYLTSVTINYFVFNDAKLMLSSQPASYTWGQFNGTNPANPLFSPDALGYIRPYNTIVGITGFHIVGDGFFQYQCNSTYPYSVSATSMNKWTFMAFDYIYLQFTYCADITPYLMVATQICYDVCPIRYSSNTSDYQCDKCPTYDCYICGNNGLCTQCNSTLDFRIMNNITNRCIPLPGYYDNGVSQAVPCVASNCLTCTSATYCLSCYSGKYLKTSSHTCQNCILNCLNCTTSGDCQLCQPSYVFVSPSCILNCTQITNCSSCILNNTTIECTVCQTGYSLVNNTCSSTCGDGIVVSPQQCDDNTTTGLNGCSSTCTVQATYFCVNSPSNCSPCVPFCNTCTNASVCLSCFTNYTYSIANNTCTIDCSLVNYCASCNFTSTINCLTCLNGFYLSSNTCSSLCGDGILVSTEQCDDHNTANGDGCSANCTIEPKYYCTGVINSTSACLSCLPLCLTCTNSSSCNGCEVGYTYNSTNCTIDCSPIKYCTLCDFSNGLTCTSCLIGYYPNGNLSSCFYTCGDGIRVAEEQCDDGNVTDNDGCSSNCTLQLSFFCVDVAIISGTTNQSSCSSCMPNCYNCTNITICIQCNADYVFNNVSSSCTIDCSNITYCSTCNYTATLSCLSCSIGYYVQNDSCVPHCGDGIKAIQESCDDSNTISNDGCSSMCALEAFFYCNSQPSNISNTSNITACSPCLSHCQNCIIGTDCELCALGYEYNLVGAAVSCDIDCSNFSFCASCIPGLCTKCAPYYLLDGSGNCQPICGDKIVLLIEGCDDGNLINGDGCSSFCTTQTNFECYNGPLQPSVCSLLNFTIGLNAINKDQSKNSVQIIYQLSPAALPAFQTANWSQIIFQVSSLDLNFTNFSYDPATGLLTVNAAYNQDINAQDLTIGFNFPPTAPFDLLQPTQTTTKLVSTNNLSLQYYNDSSYAQAKMVNIIALILTCLALLLFLLGYFSGKLVGLELITIFQLTFLSLLTIDNLSPTLNSLSFLSYSCGYNIHSLVKAPFHMDSRFIPVKLNQSFLNNYNLTAILIILPLLISLILTLINRFVYKSQHLTLSKYQMLMRGEYVFYGLMFSAYSICVAAGIEIIYIINISGILFAGVALSGILLLLFIFYSVLLHKKPGIFGQFTDKFNSISIIQSHYYCFLLLERIITSFMLLVFMIKPQSAILIGILAIQIFIIICKKPYAGERGYLRPVLNLSITIAIQLIILLTPILSSIPNYQIYSPFAILGLLAISLLYNIYYFVKECKDKQKQNLRDLVEEEQNIMKNELAKLETFQATFLKQYNNLLNNSNFLEDDSTSPRKLNSPKSPSKTTTPSISAVKGQLNRMKQTARTPLNDFPTLQLLADCFPEDLEINMQAI